MEADNRQFDGKLFLNDVNRKLHDRLAEIQKDLNQGLKEIENMHEYYWENYTEMDQYGYEDYDNQQALLQQVNANRDKSKLMKRLEKMIDSPFFGRVDFLFETEEEEEPFYIGIGNFGERAGMTPLIYDWRAPVSSLFYDFDKGEAFYEAPSGVIKGEVVSKWQYKIRGGKMIYGFESDVKIDDEILKHELGNNGDVKLKNIVRTIQKEQNSCHTRRSGKRKDFDRPSPDRLLALSRQEKFKIIEYIDSFTKQCVCRLYFSYSSGTWRGKYKRNEF